MGFWGCVFLYGTGGPGSLTTNHTVLSSFLFRYLSPSLSLCYVCSVLLCHINQYIDKKIIRTFDASSQKHHARNYQMVYGIGVEEWYVYVPPTHQNEEIKNSHPPHILDLYSGLVGFLYGQWIFVYKVYLFHSIIKS